MPTAGVRDRYRFGRFELQPAQRRLLDAGKSVPVNGRAFDLLLALVEHAGTLVTKQELLERAWPRLVVEESNLAVQVSALRRVLGTEAIENVPGHGYRFTPETVAEDASPVRAAHSRHNLPRQLTSFIGHEADLVKCAELLARTRLLTITGTGGLGKTRLSLELAEQLLPDFADGVWLVELAPLSDARLVPQAVASVLGVMEQPGRPLIETVLARTRARRLLIVLDNCEHVLQACAEVARTLLQGSPELRILATSREPMHVPGERTFLLSTLSVPEAAGKISVDALAGYEAVRLFVDRATAAHSAFQLAGPNAQAVRDICTRLEGIPLALELAAARVRVMSVALIAQRLDDRFRLLKSRDPTGPARHQTLAATIEWSYDLLTERERVLLRRLAVFPGGWVLDAAEAVCGDDVVDTAEILDLNSRLVEKSLVVVEPYGSRYRILETVRQFARERLEASAEGDAIRARHLAYYLALVEKGSDRLDGEHTWYSRLDAERENLRAAYDLSKRAEGGAETTLRFASVLAPWLCREHFELGSPILSDVLARPEVQKRDHIRCRGLSAAAFISYHKGHYEDARRHLEECLAIARDTGDIEMQTSALTVLGMVGQGLGDRVAARRSLVEALPLARKLAHRLREVDVLNTLAELDSMEGDLAAAEKRCEEALEIAREADLRHFANCILINLTRIALSRGAASRAEDMLRAALVHCEAIGSTLNAHAVLAMAGAIAASREDWKHAAQCFGASDLQLESFGLHREPTDEAMLAPLMAQTRKSLGPASFSASEAEGRAKDVEGALAAALAWIQRPT